MYRLNIARLEENCLNIGYDSLIYHDTAGLTCTRIKVYTCTVSSGSLSYLFCKKENKALSTKKAIKKKKEKKTDNGQEK